MRVSLCLVVVTMSALVAVFAQPVNADNLIVNGDFGTGDFSSWNSVSPDSFSFVDSTDGPIGAYYRGPNQGDYYYALFADWQTATLDQVVATVPGSSYAVDFWVNDLYGGSDFVAKWGPSQLLHLPTSYNDWNAPNLGWQEFSYIVPASGTSTEFSPLPAQLRIMLGSAMSVSSPCQSLLPSCSSARHCWDSAWLRLFVVGQVRCRSPLMKSRAGRSEWDIIPHRTGPLAVEIDHEASIALDVRREASLSQKSVSEQSQWKS